MKRANDPEEEKSKLEKLINFAKGLLGPGSGEGNAKDLNTILADRNRDEILWQLTSALRDSIDSIAEDDAVTDKQTAIAQVLQQFFSALIGTGVAKAGKKISASRMDMLKQMQKLLSELIAEAEPTPAEPGVNKNRGDDQVPISEEVRKNLPAEVLKHLEEVEKKAGEVDTLTAKVAELEKNAAPPKAEPEDIWKGVNPAVRKMMEDAEKRAKDAENLAKSLQEKADNEQYLAKAAKLAVPGSNPEEIAAMMKSMASDPEALAKFEAMLAATNEQIAKGALFSEAGRSGGMPAGNTVAKVEALAKEMVQKDSGLTKEMALAKVWNEHPELYAEYENEQFDTRRGN